VGRRAMCERVRDLAACGVAVLLASSDLVVVEQLAARVLVMRDGRVVRAAPTAALMGERVLEILLDAPPAAPPPGFRITPYGLQADLGTRSAEAALALCRAHRLAVRASQVRGRTLEDAVLDALRDRPRWRSLRRFLRFSRDALLAQHSHPPPRTVSTAHPAEGDA